jgi:hypothetical protein
MSIGIGFYKIEANHNSNMAGFLDYHDNDPMYGQSHGDTDYTGSGNYKGRFQGSGIHLAGQGLDLAGSGLDLAGSGCVQYEPLFEKQKGYGKLIGGPHGRPPAYLVSEHIPETVEGIRQAKMAVGGRNVASKKMRINEVRRPLRENPKIGRGKERLPGSKLKKKLMSLRENPKSGRRGNSQNSALKKLLKRL